MSNTRLFAVVLAVALATGCESKKPDPKPNATPSVPATPVTKASADTIPAAKAPAAKAPAAKAPAAKAPAAKASPEPTPAEIDALRAVAAADGFKAMGPQADLWTALYQLERWHLMTFPDSKSVPPGLNIETHDGKKWVMAFTDTARLYEYAKLRKQLDADGTMLGMTVPSRTSFKYFEGLRGIAGVRFNEGDVGWFAPMPNLRAIHTHLVKQGRLPGTPSSPAPMPAQ